MDISITDQPYGMLAALEPGIARLLARNPSPFTYTGTQSYVVGDAEVAVIDPGPDHEMRAVQAEGVALRLPLLSSTRPAARAASCIDAGQPTRPGSWPPTTASIMAVSAPTLRKPRMTCTGTEITS